MKIKNYCFIIFAVILTIIAAGCTNSAVENLTEKTQDNTIIEKTSADNDIVDSDVELAKIIAETRMMEIKEWENAEISNYFYWYNPITGEKPAYIEFKITKNNNDAGYIMVSMTDMDFEIPEYHTEGKTMYECLQKKAGDYDIKAIRFNSFSYMGEINKNNLTKRVFMGTLNYLNDVPATRSIDNDFDKYLTEYIKNHEMINGIGGTENELKSYHQTKKEEKIFRGDPIPVYSPSITEQLDDLSKFPKYMQFYDSSIQNFSGCFTTAAAIVFAYCYHKYGKTNLFSSAPSLLWSSNNTVLRNQILNIRSYFTLNSNGDGVYNQYYFWKGLVDYVNDKNYCHAIFRWYNVDATYKGDWNSVHNEIKNDHPAILLYKDHDISENLDEQNHIAAVYRSVISRNVYTGNQYEVNYSINTGFGDGEITTKTVNATSYYFYEAVTVNIW